jgi:hypothetical protein
MTQPSPDQLEQAADRDAAAALPKIVLDADLLTPADMKRARVVLDGRNPFELLDDPIDRVVLVIWCMRSRQDPSFTWAQAEATPFGEVQAAGDDRPPDSAASSSSTGSPPARNNGNRPKRSRSSAASTG